MVAEYLRQIASDVSAMKVTVFFAALIACGSLLVIAFRGK